MQLQVADKQTPVGGKKRFRLYAPVVRRIKHYEFWKKSAEVRKKNQLSQEGLADMVGVSRQAVSKWDLDDVTKEITGIQNALDGGDASCTLQYSVKCKQNLLRTIEG